MNVFDNSILSFLNEYVGVDHHFDNAIVLLSNNGFWSDGIIASLCCWAWFKHGEDKDKSKAARETFISGTVACIAGIILCRLLGMALPFRLRPLSDPTNGLHFPNGTTDWAHWSSFPSDHAILFFTLSTCLFFISRVMGWIALLDTVFVICLPRIYLGIHYPTDILAGAVIGVVIGVLANQPAVKRSLAKGGFMWAEKSSGSFYAFSFLFIYEIIDDFFDARIAVDMLIRTLHRHL
jgi:undecaprenyl-diphosphatase